MLVKLRQSPSAEFRDYGNCPTRSLKAVEALNAEGNNSTEGTSN
jgi:hypothetical protein